MASRKYRPIVMNRHKKPAKSYSGLKRVLSIIAILALFAVIIFVVKHYRNSDKHIVKTESDTEVLTKKETISIVESSKQKEPAQTPCKNRQSLKQ